MGKPPLPLFERKDDLMIFAIHAYEDTYGGYHGIEEWGFIEAEDENDSEIYEVAEIMSAQVIASYGLEDEYLEDYEDINDEERSNIVAEHYAWDIIPLPKATSVEEMERFLKEENDPDGLIERFS